MVGPKVVEVVALVQDSDVGTLLRLRLDGGSEFTFP
jgi:hypothetical protein